MPVPSHSEGMRILPAAVPSAGSSSVRGDLARYDHEQRVLATSRGRAALKMAGASVPCRDSVDPTGQSATFFWVRNGQLVCGKPHGDINVATPKLIADAVMSVGESAVALSIDVTRRIVRMMGTLPAWSEADTADMLQLRQAQRLIAFYSTLLVSSHLITLAQALDNKFYAPTGVDTTAVIDWRELFGQPKTLSGLGSLLAKVYVSSLDPKRYGNKQSDPASSGRTPRRRRREPTVLCCLHLEPPGGVHGVCSGVGDGCTFDGQCGDETGQERVEAMGVVGVGI